MLAVRRLRPLVARAQLRPLVARVQQRRSLGSWSSDFESARGASVETRQALGRKLRDVWVLEQDAAKSEAMQAEAGGTQLTFVLSVEGTAVALLRAALMPTGQETGGPTGLLIGAQVDPALSYDAVGGPLIKAARAELKRRNAERVVAVAPLPGFCKWIVDNTAWEGIDASEDADAPGAVEAVAKGRPRPGHSVLGQGTFKAARPALTTLALQYTASTLLADPDAEAAMYVASGAQVANVNYMHDATPEALAESAGCTVTLRF